MPLAVVALILPLSLDTFAVSMALGMAGISERARLRLSLLFAAFEAGMPIIGVAVGGLVSTAVGDVADYIAVLTLAILGVWMIRQDENELPDDILNRTRGLAAVGLGLSISLDEFAIGVTIGLLGLPFVFALVLIAAQAFVATQLGTRFGNRIGHLRLFGEELGEQAERAAGVVLIAIAIILAGLRVTGHAA